MRVLYGVQGTGNGHVTRARAMAPALAAVGIEADFLFSGRTSEEFFDMSPFGDYRVHRGLTFITAGGRVRPVKTALGNAPATFLRDIRTLDLTPYDLVLTDFEPVTAWAGRLQGKPVIGLGHQYAFRYPVPQRRGNPVNRVIMKYFAPADLCLGFHWHHFDTPILPPIAPVTPATTDIEPRLIVVYLPFEAPAVIADFLAPFSGYEFSVYHSRPLIGAGGHVRWSKPSHAAFHADLRRCGGVISNAGFELTSEVLQLGRKILLKPLHGQPEQLSNALALRQLGLGYTMDRLDQTRLSLWLERGRGATVHYPDVAGAVARWLARGDYQDIETLSASLWRNTRLPASPLFPLEDMTALPAEG